MSGLTRQEIKRDEIQERLLLGVEWLQDNYQKVLAVIVGIAVVIAGVMLFAGMRSRQEASAQEALAEALRIHQAPINAEGADPENEKSPSFPDEGSRRDRAKGLFEQVASDHPSSDAGRIASVYLGEIAAEEGDLATARELWSDYLDRGPRNALSAIVKLNLISLDRAEGKHAELVEELSRAVDDDSEVLPRDALLFELGLSLEDNGEPDAAKERFQELVDQFPQSPYAREARSRLDVAT